MACALVSAANASASVQPASVVLDNSARTLSNRLSRLIVTHPSRSRAGEPGAVIDFRIALDFQLLFHRLDRDAKKPPDLDRWNIPPLRGVVRAVAAQSEVGLSGLWH